MKALAIIVSDSKRATFFSTEYSPPFPGGDKYKMALLCAQVAHDCLLWAPGRHFIGEPHRINGGHIIQFHGFQKSKL